MNLNLDTSAVTRFLRGMLDELRQKKLWPIAAVLLVGIVAVPLLLSSSPSRSAPNQAPLPATPPPSGTALPALNVQSTPAHSRLSGPVRNPFGGASGSGAAGSSTSAPNLGSVASVASVAQSAVNAMSGSSSASGGSSAGSSSGSGGTASSGVASSGGSGTSTPTSSTPPSITGNAKPKPAPSGLTATQSYDVALSITNSSNGLNAIDPLERLTVLPSQQQPLLVELGVLQGGDRVLFAVQPGTVVNGPGTCLPGPVDCEILSLGQDQTESVSSSSGGASTLFAVTGVSAVGHASDAAADKARQEESAVGRSLLDRAALPALSLFRYEPSLGSVVNLSNLTVGG